MEKSYTLNPVQKVFPPIITLGVTSSGEEGWRTNQRTRPSYGIQAGASRVLAPAPIGISTLHRQAAMQRINGAYPYFAAAGLGGS